MTDDAPNVIAFQPRARQAPALQFVELRLDSETCGLEMTVTDDAGNVVAVLAYSLSFKPRDFDLDLLRAAWERWRGGSAAAS